MKVLKIFLRFNKNLNIICPKKKNSFEYIKKKYKKNIRIFNFGII